MNRRSQGCLKVLFQILLKQNKAIQAQVTFFLSLITVINSLKATLKDLKKDHFRIKKILYMAKINQTVALKNKFFLLQN